jgi:hypothetical protein
MSDIDDGEEVLEDGGPQPVRPALPAGAAAAAVATGWTGSDGCPQDGTNCKPELSNDARTIRCRTCGKVTPA